MSWIRKDVDVYIPLPRKRALRLGIEYDLCRWALGFYSYWTYPYAWGHIALGPIEITWDFDRDWGNWLAEDDYD